MKKCRFDWSSTAKRAEAPNKTCFCLNYCVFEKAIRERKGIEIQYSFLFEKRAVRGTACYFLSSRLYWQAPQAPQLPPQEQECLPFFLSIMPFMTTAAKSTPIIEATITVGTTGLIESVKFAK